MQAHFESQDLIEGLQTIKLVREKAGLAMEALKINFPTPLDLEKTILAQGVVKQSARLWSLKVNSTQQNLNLHLKVGNDYLGKTGGNWGGQLRGFEGEFDCTIGL